MKKSFYILLFFFCGTGFSQDLEERIYLATEAFGKNKTESSFQILNAQETAFRPKIISKDEQLAYIFLLLNKADYLDDENRQKLAIASYEEAWSRYNDNGISKITDYDIIEYCLKPLGILYNKAGDHTNAENIIKQYIFLAEKQKNDSHRISGGINLARLYQTVGKHKTVVQIVDNALKLPNIPTEKKQKLQNIKTTSLIALNQIQSVNELLVNDRAVTLEGLKSIVQFEIHNKNHEKGYAAFKNYKNAFLKKAHLTARDLAKLYVEEAQLFMVLNRPNDASATLLSALKTLLPNFDSESLPNKGDLYAENTFIDIFELLAKLQPTTENALECYDLGFYTASLLETDITSQEGKLLNLSSNRARSEECIALLYNLHASGNNTKYMERALSYAEKNKASVLKEVIGKKSLLQLHPNDSLLIKEQSLLKTQEQLTDQLIKTPYENSSSPETNGLRKQLNAVSIQLKNLKKEIGTNYSQDTVKAVSFENLKGKLLKDQAALIVYFYGKNAIYQFMVSENSSAFNKIELNEALKNAISKFIRFFDDPSAINNNIPAFTTEAFALYNTLYLDLSANKKNIVIIPDGKLNFLPFEALLTAITKTSNYSKMPFVVRSQSIAYSSSTEFYLQENKAHKKNNLLGVFPIFEGTNQKLTHSISEAKSIRNEIDSKFLMYASATKKNFIENASKYGILHLSTHASSGDFTVPASIEFASSTLYLNELYSLDLDADLVVLSACETGIGRLQRGEGPMSIARGFQYAGTQNILFSLWQINDLSTSQIMQLFYKSYNGNGSAFTANHHSKIAYLNNEDIGNIKKSPYYWSAFVYYGSIRPEAPKNNSLFVLLGAIIVFIVIFLTWKPR